MKKLILIIACIFLVATVIFLTKDNNQKEPNTPNQSNTIHDDILENEEINKKAAFLIYTNGTKRIFTATMYHNRSDDVFITSTKPEIVNIKKQGITWNDFFASLPLSLNQECLTTGTGQTFCSNNSSKLRFYLNGSEDKDILNSQIENNDRLLVTYTRNSENIDHQLQTLNSVEINN